MHTSPRFRALTPHKTTQSSVLVNPSAKPWGIQGGVQEDGVKDMDMCWNSLGLSIKARLGK